MAIFMVNILMRGDKNEKSVLKKLSCYIFKGSHLLL